MGASGWCSGPDGFRLKCDGCKSPTCDHECAQNPCSERRLSIQSGKMADNETAPRRCVNTVNPRGLADEWSID